MERKYMEDIDSLEKYLLTALKITIINDAEWAEKISKKFKDKIIWEFGVYTGNSTRIYSKRAKKVIGFDSFLGLPDHWNNENGNVMAPAHTFNLGGKAPHFHSNVEIVKGLYQNILDEFLEKKPINPNLIIIDCDIYSSTIFLLEKLHEKKYLIGPEVCFDEIYDFRKSTRNNELAALYDFLKKNPQIDLIPVIRGKCVNGDSGKVSVIFNEEKSV